MIGWTIGGSSAIGRPAATCSLNPGSAVPICAFAPARAAPLARPARLFGSHRRAEQGHSLFPRGELRLFFERLGERRHPGVRHLGAVRLQDDRSALPVTPEVLARGEHRASGHDLHPFTVRMCVPFACTTVFATYAEPSRIRT